LVAVDITTQPGFSFGAPSGVAGPIKSLSGFSVPTNHDIAPDGQRIVAVVASGQKPGVFAASQVHIVLNWFEELKARVPLR